MHGCIQVCFTPLLTGTAGKAERLLQRRGLLTLPRSHHRALFAQVHSRALHAGGAAKAAVLLAVAEDNGQPCDQGMLVHAMNLHVNMVCMYAHVLLISCWQLSSTYQFA